MCDLPRSREFDYEALCAASKHVQHCIAVDRAVDVESRLLARSNELVYAPDKEGADAAATEGVDYSGFVPMPRSFLALYAQARGGSCMGLLPEIHHAWISIDNRLYLWDYASGSRDTFSEFDGFAAHDAILDVRLAAPKAGVFVASVKYVLVVVSLLEVTLLSVSASSPLDGAEGAAAHMLFQRTMYRAPTAGAACRVASSLGGGGGSAAGSVFLASSEGSIYELEYSAALFDSQLLPVDAIRRSFAALVNLLSSAAGAAAAAAAAAAPTAAEQASSPAADQPISFTCQLRSVGRWDTLAQSSGLHGLLPLFRFLQPPPGLRLVSVADIAAARKSASASGSGNGSSSGSGSGSGSGAAESLEQHLLDAVLDDRLRLLLTCSSGGFLKMFRLAPSGAPGLACCGAFNVISAARTYLAAEAAAGPAAALGAEVTATRMLLLSTQGCRSMHVAVLLSSGARVHLQAVHADNSPCLGELGEKDADVRLKVLSVLRLPSAVGNVQIDHSSSRSAFYSNGVYILGDAASSGGAREEAAGILCLTQDCRLKGMESSSNSFREVVTVPLGCGDGRHELHSALRDIREDTACSDSASSGHNLHDLAMQYSNVRLGSESGSRRRFLCLESHGIHVLVKRQPLAWVRTAVEGICALKAQTGRRQQADRERKKSVLSGLMREYGVTEFCTMVVCAVVTSVNPAVCNEDLPMLLLHNTECNSSHLIRADGQFTFIPSPVVRGMRSLFARMVMHLWECQITSSALDVAAVQRVLDPLSKLEALLLSAFHYGISEAPLTAAEQEGLLKPEPAAASRARLPDDKFVKNALENSALASLFRLVTRTRQLLAVLEAVQQQEQEQIFPWQMLDRHTLQSLVGTEEGARAASSMLRQGLKNMAAAQLSGAAGGGADADALAGTFHRAAPSYFHIGDLRESRAYRRLLRALHAQSSRTDLADSLQSVRQDLLFAATFWRQISDVSSLPRDTSSSGSGSDSVACPLGLYCKLLAQVATDASLEMVVDLCQVAARNFSKNGPLHVSAADVSSSDALHYGYHSGSKLSPQEQRQGQQLCHAHLLGVICSSDSRAASNRNGDGVAGREHITERQRQCMLSKCLSMSSDELFLFMICDSLRGRQTHTLLMHLPCVDFVERYLYSTDKDLLYEWYFARALSAAQAAADNSAGSGGTSLRTVSSPERLSVGGPRAPDGVVAEGVSTDAAWYMVEQYERASMLMFEVAGCPHSTDDIPYAVRPIEVSTMGGNPGVARSAGCGEYAPIALRCHYLQNAVHAAQGALNQMCSMAGRAIAGAGGKKRMQREAAEICRLRRWWNYLQRLLKLAEIQMDAYKTSLAANVYAADSRAGAGAGAGTGDSLGDDSAGGSNKLAKVVQTPEDGVAAGKAASGALPFHVNASSGHGGASHQQQLETLSSNINFILGFTLISEAEWADKYFSTLREMCLWDINLRLLSVLGKEAPPDDSPTWGQRTLQVSESLAIKLWKSYIYREVPDFTLRGALAPLGGSSAYDASAAAGASVNAFLMKQRSPSEIYTDTLHSSSSAAAAAAAGSRQATSQPRDRSLWNSLAQYRDVPFERYEVWLPLLKKKVEALCRHLQVGDGGGGEPAAAAEDAAAGDMRGPRHGLVHSCKLCMPTESSALAAPLAPLIVELDALTAELHRMHQTSSSSAAAATSHISSSDGRGALPPLRGWVADLLLSVHIRLISVVRAYASIFRTRAKGFGPEKNVMLLESLSYVLLTWVDGAARIVRGGNGGAGGQASAAASARGGKGAGDIANSVLCFSLSAGDLHDLREVVCTRELDDWLDLLRHHLSDMQGRRNLGPHCQASLQRIQKEFACLLSQVDALNFR